jgi:protein-S-isoprenylcysteine O-methyltransferase Ste14
MIDKRTFGERGGWWVVAQFIFIPAGAIAAIVWAGPPSSGIVQIVLRIAAGLFLIAGLLIAGLGVARLGRNLTAFPRPMASSFLVKSGVYGLVRHPIYTGVICLVIALACAFDSWVGAGLAVVVFVFFDLKSRREEAWLAEKFADYRGYQSRVKKLIPFVY